MIIGIVLALGTGAFAQLSTGNFSDFPRGDTLSRIATTNRSDTVENAKKKEVPKVTIVKRNFSYREELGVALGMMAFIALLMTANQSLNPD